MNHRGFAKKNKDLIVEIIRRYGPCTSHQASEFLFKDFMIEIHPRGIATMLMRLKIPYRAKMSEVHYPSSRPKEIRQWEWYVPEQSP